jgi:hypothetical protein
MVNRAMGRQQGNAATQANEQQKAITHFSN